MSGRGAGLLTTEPLVLNSDPWQVHTNVVPDAFAIVQPSSRADCRQGGRRVPRAWRRDDEEFRYDAHVGTLRSP